MSNVSNVFNIIDELAATRRLIDTNELAGLLGVSRKHVFKMASKGSLPSVRLGSSVRYNPSDVCAWLRERGVA